MHTSCRLTLNGSAAHVLMPPQDPELMKKMIDGASKMMVSTQKE